jgi:HEAT repeat protein
MHRGHLRFTFVLSIAGLVLVAIYTFGQQKPSPQPTAADLIGKLGVGDRHAREDAAEALAQVDDPQIVPALRERLKQESDFHVRLALQYALASQGEKSAVPELIASLRQTGHLGAVYLGRISGKDFGWEIEQWETWNRETTDEAFRKSARDAILGRPAQEEWQRFADFYSAQYFEALGFGDPDQRLTEEDRKKLAELPTAKAWGVYESAIAALQESGDRPLAAKRFREVATKYAGTVYAANSQELADNLDKMIEEDRQWKEPKDISALTQPEKIGYHVYHLRDVVAHQWGQPGNCNVLSGLSFDKEPQNSAKALLEIGEPAIPALLDLLDDQRPIRAVGYWRDFHPTRTVLRYQDAAIQVLNELLPGAPFRRRTTSSYLSAEDEDDRAKFVEGLRKAWARDKDKTPLERQWSSVDELGIHSALEVLEKLAEQPSEKERVLKKLREMFDKRHWVYQPCVAELMAKLGDTSKVQEVLDHLRQERYAKHSIRQPDDPGASISAEEAAKRLRQKYGESEP